MNSDIQFWFDFSSPYGFLAAQRISEIEQETNRKVSWNPYLMGALFKTTGRQPVINHPMVWDYAKQDVARIARKLNITLQLPSTFPIATVAACRACYWAQENHGISEAIRLINAIYNEYFQNDRLISEAATVLEIAGEAGFNTIALEKGMNSAEIKSHLRDVIQTASDNNIFGSPFFRIDGESFWGC